MNSAYILGASGSDPPPEPRQYKAPDRLVEKCLQWLDQPFYVDTAYNKAKNALKGVCTNIAEANSLLLHPTVQEHEHYSFVGSFVSAAYSYTRERTVVLEFDIPGVHYLGVFFPGLLINKGRVGSYFGAGGDGITINTGTTGGDAAIGSEGVFINAGDTGVNCGKNSNAIIINAGNASSWFGKSGRGMLVNAGAIIPAHLAHPGFGQHHEGRKVFLEDVDDPEIRYKHYIDDRIRPAFRTYCNRLIACAKATPEITKKRFGSASRIKYELEARLEGWK